MSKDHWKLEPGSHTPMGFLSFHPYYDESCHKSFELGWMGWKTPSQPLELRTIDIYNTCIFINYQITFSSI